MQILAMEFYFVRHGETDYNKKGICQGQLDITLNKEGLLQAQTTAHILKEHKINSIVSSSLIRAFNTAEIIANYVNLPITTMNGLQEHSWEDMEGQPIGDGLWRESYLKNNETNTQFTARIKECLSHIFTSFKPPILIVSHGGIYCAIAKTLKLNLSEIIKNRAPIYHRPPENKQDNWFTTHLKLSE